MTAPASAAQAPVLRPVVPKEDLSWGKRHGLKVWLLILGAVGTFLFVKTYAGAYFDLLQTWSVLTTAYHKIFPVDWIRHLIVRDESEKAEALIAGQVIVYYFANKWPRKAPRWWDTVEGWLGIANERLPHQGIHVLFLAPLWALIYVLPGEGVGALVLWLTHQNAAEPKPWQVTAVGILGSFFMGRRLAKGFAYRLQEKMIQLRLEQGHDRPAWWMHWPIQRRFEYEVAEGTIEARPTHHPALRHVWHATSATVVVLGFIFLTYQGWWVTKYLQPFPFSDPLKNVVHFSITDLWQSWF